MFLLIFFLRLLCSIQTDSDICCFQTSRTFSFSGWHQAALLQTCLYFYQVIVMARKKVNCGQRQPGDCKLDLLRIHSVVWITLNGQQVSFDWPVPWCLNPLLLWPVNVLFTAHNSSKALGKTNSAVLQCYRWNDWGAFHLKWVIITTNNCSRNYWFIFFTTTVVSLSWLSWPQCIVGFQYFKCFLVFFALLWVLNLIFFNLNFQYLCN